jgi:distribution and morphology protein 12
MVFSMTLLTDNTLILELNTLVDYVFQVICGYFRHVIPALMSIDLEWSKLDASLATYLVDVLNKQLGSVERPSFIGPVEVTSLDFGSTSPDVELVDLRDIYRDFVEEDDDLDRVGPIKAAEDEEPFEWVSRRAVGREEGLAYQHLPPHIRYGRSGPTDLFESLPPPVPVSDTASDISENPPIYRSPSPATPFTAGPFRRRRTSNDQSSSSQVPLIPSPRSLSEKQPSLQEKQQQSQQQQPSQDDDPHPNLQLHLHINWHSNLRITLTTSLLINYPSPMFMSLPIKLSVTGLVFTGELAVAYEGQRRRVHLCILDDLDPYGPASERAKRDSAGHTPPEMLDDESSPSPSSVPSRPSKPLPVGQRLLPSIFIESEIGQADKHVLKNVTRIERFIQDVIRKTLEEELVFPNFHTLLMDNQDKQ